MYQVFFMNTDSIVGSIISAFTGLLSALKTVVLVVATWALATYSDYVQPSFIKPIPPNTYYSRSLLGNIYFRSSECGIIDCSKIAIYMPLHNVDKDSFFVFTVPAPSGNEGFIVESNYARDKFRIFYKDETIHLADAASFRALSVNLARDEKQYFVFNKSLKVYFTQAADSPFRAEDGPTEILSYSPDVFLILKQNNRYFHSQPTQIPADIREISEEESGKYPRLELAQQ